MFRRYNDETTFHETCSRRPGLPSAGAAAGMVCVREWPTPPQAGRRQRVMLREHVVGLHEQVQRVTAVHRLDVLAKCQPRRA
jgi:hypothetical protein